MIESLWLTASDGVRLDAELALPDGPPRAGVVVCHPHPQFGGSMRTLVVQALFDALTGHGIACLRFDFRGVGRSAGTHTGGDAERLDVLGAIEALGERLEPTVPLVLAGWSFGGDMALSVAPERIAAWFGIAPPLRYVHDLDVVAADPRPKLLALAEGDEVRAPSEVVAQVAGWANTHVEVLPGASHFFAGSTGLLVGLAVGLAGELAQA
ncbi:MAG: uncharacterized protein QOG20_2945 [Pseudonocardiales bacterium]|jgi:alpha/beta superfamily hydrolase|nr:uncharacterized protein [Pseudonocardiales bacterium]